MQHLLAFLARLDAQADAEFGVGPDLLLDHAGRALGGQDQVDAQRAPYPRDTDQPVHEIWIIVDQLGKLVNDHHQARQRFLNLALPVQILVGANVVHASIVEQSLAPVHLGLQCHQRPLGQVAGKVGDHTQCVRQSDQFGKGATALEIHQDETHVVGVMRQR